MTLVICICTYNRNHSLERCLKSINKLNVIANIKIRIVIVDNSFSCNSYKLLKKYKIKSKYKITLLHEKRRGIVNARNKYLKALKKINPKFVCFLDDDCIIDSSWLKNVFKLLKSTNAEIITGPQIPLKRKSLYKSNFISYSNFFEKKYEKDVERVKWAASNNVFLLYKIIKKHNLIFDKTLNKFGIGEDQLFFTILNKYGHKIYWSKNVKVYEIIHDHRQSLNWLTRRSFRLGILGYYIDKKLHGAIAGFIINYLKSIYYFVKSICCLFLFFNTKFKIQIFNFFYRFIGRLVGPIFLKRIDFFRK